MKKYILLTLFCLSGCDNSNRTKADTNSTSVVEQSGLIPNTYITTITHDSHKFILFNSVDPRGGTFVIHHPDCPCQTKTENYFLENK